MTEFFEENLKQGAASLNPKPPQTYQDSLDWNIIWSWPMNMALELPAIIIYTTNRCTAKTPGWAGQNTKTAG
jgi:hypothetical protein